jgi:hypothetical protein
MPQTMECGREMDIVPAGACNTHTWFPVIRGESLNTKGQSGSCIRASVNPVWLLCVLCKTGHLYFWRKIIPWLVTLFFLPLVSPAQDLQPRCLWQIGQWKFGWQPILDFSHLVCWVQTPFGSFCFFLSNFCCCGKDNFCFLISNCQINQYLNMGFAPYFL